jgi:hypothetical protein
MRLLKRLARAAAAIHELGGSHGAITARTIVIDDGVVPTVMAAGLGPVLAGAKPIDDVSAIIALVAAMIGADPSMAGLAAKTTAEVRALTPAFVIPYDGESLYAAADAVDIAVLAALGSR